MAAVSQRMLSVEVADAPEVAGETKPRRSYASPQEIISLPFPAEPEVNTIHAAFVRATNKFPERPFLGHRAFMADGSRGAYVWATFRQVFSNANKIAKGLNLLCGIEPKQCVGIYSINRPEWTTTLLGLYTRAMVCVPLYDTLGAMAVSFILNHASLTTVVCEKSKMRNILEAAKDCPGLKHIVVFEDVEQTDRDAATAKNVQLHTLNELLAAAEDEAQGLPPTPPAIDDLAYIMYTSGTTGDPKGVLLTHQNVLASAAGLLRSDTENAAMVREDDVYISYLPLAHSFETCMQVLCLLTGACVGFYQGDVRKLVSDDLPTLKPTVMAGVPRVYSRVYDKITQGAAEKGFFGKLVFDWAFSSQQAAEESRDRSKFWDAIVFDKVKARLGGRVRLMATGAAPMSADLQKFLRTVFGCPVLQGYGMTENSAAAFAMPIWYDKNGTVGGPLPCTQFKLVDVEDMGYTAKDVYPPTAEAFAQAAAFKGEFNPALAGSPFPRGEVWLHGANVFRGYYRLETETKETLTEDGWLKTGDIGQINPDGSLSIIDRKKNIFKLSQGEYVAAEQVEQAVGTAPLVMQVWIYGNSFKTTLVAVAVPDRDVLMKLAAEKGWGTDFATVAARPDVKKLIFDDLTAAGKAAKLKGFEFPKAVHIETNVDAMGLGFTVENDCLTPTQKLRRPQLLKRYQAQVDAMYLTIPE